MPSVACYECQRRDAQENAFTGSAHLFGDLVVVYAHRRFLSFGQRALLARRLVGILCRALGVDVCEDGGECGKHGLARGEHGRGCRGTHQERGKASPPVRLFVGAFVICRGSPVSSAARGVQRRSAWASAPKQPPARAHAIDGGRDRAVESRSRSCSRRATHHPIHNGDPHLGCYSTRSPLVASESHRPGVVPWPPPPF